MNKKILDVAVTFLFSICLIVTANIQEEYTVSDAGESKTGSSPIAEGKTDGGVAGVSHIFSEYSFTTESGEKAIIARKENYRVTIYEEVNAENALLEKNGTPGEQDAAGAAVQEMTEGAAVQKTADMVAREADASVQKTADADAAIQEAQKTETEQSVEHKYTNRWNIVLTDEEIDLLARIVWLESNGEPVKGQEAVVEVIFNRMASELYPNTLYDVLSQKNPTQFCSWKNRDRAEPTEKEYQSIYNVLNGNTNILRNDTLYFSTEPLTSRLDVQIGGHSFCY